MAYPTKQDVIEHLRIAGASNRGTSKMSRELKNHFSITFEESNQSRFNKNILHSLKEERKICMEKFSDKDSIGRTVKQLHCWLPPCH